MKLSERLARGAIVMRDTAQMKTQHPEWLLNEMEQSADLLDEAAALARRVEGAAVRNVVGQQWDDVFAREGNVVWCSDLNPGQRVRLVPEVGS